MKKTTLSLALIAPLVLAACSSDDDGDNGDSADQTPAAQTPDTSTPATSESSIGSYQFIFTNTSTSQPMTPPVVAIHTPQSESGGIRLFEVGQPAISQVVAIAERGDNMPLVEVATGQLGQTVSAAGVAFVDPAAPGPIMPGESATLTLNTELDGQVMSFVSMVVCTNDGFSGIDSAPLPAQTFTDTVPVYDAGSESNILMLNYWVPPCNGGSSENITDEEGGVVAAHPGQSGSENPVFDFPAGAELLQVSVTRN